MTRDNQTAIEQLILAAEGKCELHEIPIEECNEELVCFPKELSYPYYRRHLGLGREELYLRKTVAEMLLSANGLANEQSYSIHLYDGYRDNDLQRDLFDMYLALRVAPLIGYGKFFQNVLSPQRARTKLADLPQETQRVLIRATSRYVALPSLDENLTRIANHRTGGSADVWLYRDGEPCDLGVAFDHTDEESAAFYHLREERRPWPTKGADQEVTFNRTLLLECMLGSGFTVYPHEIWHFDFGNQRFSRINGGNARYGAADHLVAAFH